MLQVPDQIIIKDDKQKVSSMSKKQLEEIEERDGIDTLIQEYSEELANIAFSELKEFISIMYGTCIRFFNDLLDKSDLDELKEDLIERITTMLFYNEGLTNLILHFCKILTKSN